MLTIDLVIDERVFGAGKHYHSYNHPSLYCTHQPVHYIEASEESFGGGRCCHDAVLKASRVRFSIPSTKKNPISFQSPSTIGI